MKRSVIWLIRDSYVAAIRNSLGSRQYRVLYVRDGGRRRDAAEDGRLSCAVYVSGLLSGFGLIDRIHGTVRGTVFALEKAGWRKVSRPRTGSVVVWAPPEDKANGHPHIGFAVGEGKAVSHSARKRTPALHPVTMAGDDAKPRRIEAVYWHPSLG